MSAPTIPSEEPTQSSPDALNRKWKSRSDEEIVEHMDTRNLPHRKGWPQLPCLPVKEDRQGARSAVHNPDDMIESVHLVCHQHKLTAIQIYFSFRVPSVREKGENYLTLVVTADLSNDPNLFPLIVQIRKCLQQDSRNERIAIEIIDERVVHGLNTFNIKPRLDGKLIEDWDLVYDTALAIISGHNERMLTMELLRRGIFDDAEQCPPTLVVTSPTAGKDIWVQTIVPEIQRKIGALFPDLKVELLCGTSVFL